jgi:hypothetical protein
VAWRAREDLSRKIEKFAKLRQAKLGLDSETSSSSDAPESNSYAAASHADLESGKGFYYSTFAKEYRTECIDIMWQSIPNVTLPDINMISVEYEVLPPAEVKWKNQKKTGKGNKADSRNRIRSRNETTKPKSS